MLSQVEQDTLLAIANNSDGYRLAVPVGLPGVSRMAVEALAQYGMVVAEWDTEMDHNIGNSMGWNVRLTDMGINYIRGNIEPRNGPVPVFDEGMEYGIIDGICVESSLLDEARGSKLKKDLKLKTGEVIRQGTIVKVEWPSPHERGAGRIVRFRVPGRSEPVTILAKRAYMYVSGIGKPPSIKRLEKMAHDGVITTPTGKRVEPDGYGSDNSPSWLLALRFI